jgi:hypothetical protein
MSYYLNQHPQLLLSLTKEVHFFDGGMDPDIDLYKNGQNWYRRHFSLRRRVNPNLRTFEASPRYLLDPRAPERIYQLIPQVKIIILLRNPIERAISNYYYQKRKGRDPLSLREALYEEEKRLEPALQNRNYKHYNFITYSYKLRGHYKEQIERFLKYFSWEKMLILKSEDFFSNPETILRQVYDFVGVNPGFKINDLKPQNGAIKSDIDPDLYKYLSEYFAPHNQALYELVGKNYGW